MGRRNSMMLTRFGSAAARDDSSVCVDGALPRTRVEATVGWPIRSQAAPTTLTNGDASADRATSAVRGTNGCSSSVGLVTQSGEDTP